MGEPANHFQQPIHGERCLIGIDPGSATGICILTLPSRKLELFTLDFWSVYDIFRQSPGLRSVSQIHIEQPAMIKAFYGRHTQKLEEAGSKAVSRDRMVWNCAENAREGTLLGEGLRRLGFTVFDCRPVGRRKWTHADFQEVTGYPNRSNQHVRDATFLVWGKQWQET
jgi:hypothetical protein